MNKQQLASRIWAAANKMRSKIDANEYKDYFLGFIFYKFLSDGVEKKLRADGWDDDDIKSDLEAGEGLALTIQSRYSRGGLVLVAPSVRLLRVCV